MFKTWLESVDIWMKTNNGYVVLPLEIEGRGDEGGGDGGLPQDIRGAGGHSGVSQGGRMRLGHVQVHIATNVCNRWHFHFHFV